MPEENWKEEELQRCPAKSPHQPETVQAGSDPVHVIGLKLKQKD